MIDNTKEYIACAAIHYNRRTSEEKLEKEIETKQGEENFPLKNN